MVQDALMRLREAADYLRIKPATLYRWTSRGTIAFSKPNGRVLYFRREDLDRWANQNRNVPAYELAENGGRK